MDEITRAVECATDWTRASEVVEKYESRMQSILNQLSVNDIPKVEKLVIACVRNGDSAIFDSIARKLIEKRKLIDWKNQSKFVEDVLHEVERSSLKYADDIDGSKYYNWFVDAFISQLVTHDVIDCHVNSIFSIIRASLSSSRNVNCAIHTAAACCMVQLPWSKHQHLIPEVVKLTAAGVEANPLAPSNSWVHPVESCCYSCAFRDVLNTAVHKECLPTVVRTMRFCVNQEWSSRENQDDTTISYGMLLSIMEVCLSGAGSDFDGANTANDK